MSDDFRVGDKISMEGPSVPRELWGKHFIVEAVDDSSVKLSQPYNDAECTELYVPDDPTAHLYWPGMPFGK